MNYNFVIAGGDGFYNAAYYDLQNMPNVKYHPNFLSGVKSKLIRFLIRLNFNLRLNKYIKTPFNSIVNKYIYPYNFKDNNPICYIFFECHFSVINTSYISYLRSKHPSARFVLYMQDIVASLPYYNVEHYRKQFDLILSYDNGDCQKYGFLYYSTPFSKIDIQGVANIEDIDVFFCGAAKTRYNIILDAYRRFTSHGLKCKFYITGVPEEFRIQGDGIYYDQPISYLDNLRYVAASKCILEVMQENADGFTPRLWEAIMYDKHLITNNTCIKHSLYWNQDGIHFLNECENYSFINEEISYPYHIKESKSPIKLLYFIEQHIC